MSEKNWKDDKGLLESVIIQDAYGNITFRGKAIPPGDLAGMNERLLAIQAGELGPRQPHRKPRKGQS